MALQIEWLRGWGRKLSAEEVKKLPVGTEVVLHRADRHGEHVALYCSLLYSGKNKKLAYRDGYGERQLLPIRDAENQAYTLKKV